jgi:hypothetical protein
MLAVAQFALDADSNEFAAKLLTARFAVAFGFQLAKPKKFA